MFRKGNLVRLLYDNPELGLRAGAELVLASEPQMRAYVKHRTEASIIINGQVKTIILENVEVV